MTEMVFAVMAGVAALVVWKRMNPRWTVDVREDRERMVLHLGAVDPSSGRRSEVEVSSVDLHNLPRAKWWAHVVEAWTDPLVPSRVKERAAQEARRVHLQ